MPAFDALVVKTPTIEEAEEGKLEEKLYSERDIIAKDQESVGMSVLMEAQAANPQVDGVAFNDLIKAGRIKVLVRPFM